MGVVMPRRRQKVIYVDAKAKPGGNGTQKRPFQTMGEVGIVPEVGTIYFIAPGSYEEFLQSAKPKKPRGRPRGRPKKPTLDEPDEVAEFEE
jgi:hypothetical protein